MDPMRMPDPAGPAVEPPIEVQISMSDDVFIKQIVIPKAGTLVPQHSHHFDHTSLLAVGALRVWADGVCLGEFQAPVPVRIRAGVQHAMLSLVDGTVFYCIHNTARAGIVEVLEEGRLPEPIPEPEPDGRGMVLAEEPWPVFWRDGQALFQEHVAEIGGDRPAVPLDINTALLDRLDDVGAAHIMTVRSNGRMFGYLCTVIGPSLENASLLVGTMTAFYVSQDARGMGPRLLRAALDSLRTRGVGEVIMRAGVRGTGPRLGALYRRLGAVPHGELFSLMLSGKPSSLPREG